jgi:hypothetical protein
MINKEISGKVFIHIAAPVSDVYKYVVDLKQSFPGLFRGFGKIPGAVCVIPSQNTKAKSDLIRFSDGTALCVSVEKNVDNLYFKILLNDDNENSTLSSFMNNAESTWLFEDHKTYTVVTWAYNINLKSSYYCNVASLIFSRAIAISQKEYLLRLKRFVENKKLLSKFSETQSLKNVGSSKAA